MSVIPNLKDIKDLAPISTADGKDGSVGEFDLRIIKAQETTGKNTGRNGILCVIEVVDEDLVSNIMHSVWFGNDGKFTKDDDEKSDMMWRMVKDFLGSIGLSRDGDVELDEFEDIQFTAELTYSAGLDEDGKPTHRPKNEIGRILG
jgi:hypothetical protein